MNPVAQEIQSIRTNSIQHGIETWGQDSDHNILYITGNTGTGKSTLAESYRNRKTTIIHLDGYFDLSHKLSRNQSPKFNLYMNKLGFNFMSLANKSFFLNHLDSYIEHADHFSELLESFAQSEFKEGRRVVVEGIQLQDDTLYPDKSFFSDKPVIQMTTDIDISEIRAALRDKNEIYEVATINDRNEDVLYHYGVKRRSGRYPWGSGKNPYQHSGDFLARVNELKRQGMNEKEICKNLEMTTTDYRMQVRRANHERRATEVARAKDLRDKGYSLNQIAKEMGYTNDSSVRSLLNENTQARKSRADETAEILKKEIEEKGVIDVGAGNELTLGVSRQTLQEALFILETEGYAHFGISIGQVTNKRNRTTYELISKGDKPVNEIQSEIYNDPAKIKQLGEYHSDDSGKTFEKVHYPESIDSSRVGVVYGDQGGTAKDGLIEIRRGVPDLTLGNSSYAQVRILVDGDKYLKGMAVYSDDLPDGVDILFNTNKHSGTPVDKVLKSTKDDPDNPFGAYLPASGQTWYDGADGKKHLSAVNKLKEEGDWDDMSKKLSSQFLSKQPIGFIKSQLDLTYKDYEDQLAEIEALDNQTVKKKLLQDFADTVDGAVVHMKAAALPRQSSKVLLPSDQLKDGECYAPSLRDGEKVVLIRYPHAGTFEIPELTVNNKNPKLKKEYGDDLPDAIVINSKAANQLSGADFDGDTATVIPVNSRVKVKTRKPFEELQDFDPKVEYSTEGKTGVRLMKKSEKQKQMGMISNLITDMTLQGAPDEELVKAVRHSMVVIDAEKHKLDFKQSEKDNDIATLKKRWQGYTAEDGSEKSGASTLLSRRKQDVRVDERRGSARVDPETGELVYKTTGRTYVDAKTGKVVKATTTAKLLNETKDLHTLSSGTPAEEAYADYGNKLKALANKVRKEYVSIDTTKRNASAAETYKGEVESLKSKLRIAQMNAPKERQAQAIANSVVNAKKQDNPGMDDKEIKKISQSAIESARAQVGATGKGTKVEVTPSEWNAIQAHAISDNMLSQILRYADMDKIRDYATPKTKATVSGAKLAKARAMKNTGYTLSEIADSLGVSTSTVSKALK